MIRVQSNASAMLVVASLLLVVSCASSNKSAPVAPGTFAIGLPPLAPGLSDEAYCVTPVTGADCHEKGYGEQTCQKRLRNEGEKQLYLLMERVGKTEKTQIGLDQLSGDDNIYFEKLILSSEYRPTLREFESNVFRVNGGTDASMRVCVTNEEGRYDVLLKLHEAAVRDGRSAVAQSLKAYTDRLYPKGYPDPARVKDEERAIAEHFDDLYRQSLKASTKTR